MFSIRAWNIALRTAHIGAMGVLLGGHAFDVERSRLVPSLLICIATGVFLGFLEAGPRMVWFHQGRGLCTLGKLLLLVAVPFLWNYRYYRFAILLLVVVIASVGSHMPARFRYYSILYGKVTNCQDGPGTAELNTTPLDARSPGQQTNEQETNRPL